MPGHSTELDAKLGGVDGATTIVTTTIFDPLKIIGVFCPSPQGELAKR